MLLSICAAPLSCRYTFQLKAGYPEQRTEGEKFVVEEGGAAVEGSAPPRGAFKASRGKRALEAGQVAVDQEAAAAAEELGEEEEKDMWRGSGDAAEDTAGKG